jgi:hypothetical protein
MLFGQRDAGDPAFRTTTSNVSHKSADEIEPRRYQTNASLSQPPTRAADRPVREYATNVAGGERVEHSVG